MNVSSVLSESKRGSDMAIATKPETAVTERQNTELTPAKAFRVSVSRIATDLLKDWVGDARAQEAVGRVASALAASAASAKNPTDFYQCTPQSVGAVIAISALTGIMPSTGANALAYAIPRRPRKGEAPQLQYQLSHRGLAALAKRSGQALVAIPISVRDKIKVDDGGDAVIESRDIDNPPLTLDDLRGIIVVVRERSNGAIVCRGWVPKSVILARRDSSDAYKFASKNDWAQTSDPWHKWPIEMAIKAAMHYATARGWCVIDDTEAVRALAMDVESSAVVIDAIATPELKRGVAGLESRLGIENKADAEPSTAASFVADESEPAETPESLIEKYGALLRDIDTQSRVKLAFQKASEAVEQSDWPQEVRDQTMDRLANITDAKYESLKQKKQQPLSGTGGDEAA